MQLDTIQNERTDKSNVEGAKAVWHRPGIARIDIKRTLLGSGPSTDGVAGGFTK